ncbi:T9SS type A sorting domain-containing protein [Calditrichota bacterium]
MKSSKIFSFISFLIIMSNFSLANPIILFHINEFQTDSSGWKLELKNLEIGLFTSLDSCCLTTMTDTAYFKSGIAADSFLVITQDSMLESLSINRLGDILGFHYLDEYLLDQIGFGNITSGSLIASPQMHQSICLREWREEFQRYYYYLDNTPTFGQKNDSSNAKGYVSGVIADSLGNPLAGGKVVYDYYDAPYPYYYDISVFTDSIGYFIIKDFARLNRLEIRKDNYQTEYRSLQIWPEDTVTVNVTLSSVIDIINKDISTIIDNYSLSQNFPNPFNNETSFNYSLPKASFVEISVYDLRGKLVDKLFSGKQHAGEYKANWNAGSLASGVYLYQLKTNELIKNKKCLLIK